MIFADVSVVIPCYRCSDVIERAVTSVWEQTLRPAEVILVDDCSGDGTVDTLYALQKKFPPNWIKVIELEQNSGPGEARNAGWAAASHSYVAFLDADDSWHPQKIEIQYSWMIEHPDVVLTGHECVRHSGNINHAHEITDSGPVRVYPYRKRSFCSEISDTFGDVTPGYSSQICKRKVSLRGLSFVVGNCVCWPSRIQT